MCDSGCGLFLWLEVILFIYTDKKQETTASVMLYDHSLHDFMLLTITCVCWFRECVVW